MHSLRVSAPCSPCVGCCMHSLRSRAPCGPCWRSDIVKNMHEVFRCIGIGCVSGLDVRNCVFHMFFDCQGSVATLLAKTFEQHGVCFCDGIVFGFALCGTQRAANYSRTAWPPQSGLCRKLHLRFRAWMTQGQPVRKEGASPLARRLLQRRSHWRIELPRSSRVLLVH